MKYKPELKTIFKLEKKQYFQMNCFCGWQTDWEAGENWVIAAMRKHFDCAHSKMSDTAIQKAIGRSLLT